MEGGGSAGISMEAYEVGVALLDERLTSPGLVLAADDTSSNRRSDYQRIGGSAERSSESDGSAARALLRCTRKGQGRCIDRRVGLANKTKNQHAGHESRGVFRGQHRRRGSRKDGTGLV